MSKSGETGLGGERQYDDLDIHHPFAPGTIFDIPDIWCSGMSKIVSPCYFIGTVSGQLTHMGRKKILNELWKKYIS